jgi:hypothetical protein
MEVRDTGISTPQFRLAPPMKPVAMEPRVFSITCGLSGAACARLQPHRTR